MDKQFGSLLLIGRLLKIIGAAELIIAGVSLILFPLILSGSDGWLLQFGFPSVAPGSGLVSGMVAGVTIFVGGTAAGLLTFSSGKLFELFIEMQENTSNILHLLENKK